MLSAVNNGTCFTIAVAKLQLFLAWLCLKHLSELPRNGKSPQLTSVAQRSKSLSPLIETFRKFKGLHGGTKKVDG